MESRNEYEEIWWCWLSVRGVRLERIGKMKNIQKWSGSTSQDWTDDDDDDDHQQQLQLSPFIIYCRLVIFVDLFIYLFLVKNKQTNSFLLPSLSYLPTPPLGQNMTQGQFLSGV